VTELRAAGTTIILCAHQMDLVERAADRVLLMNKGREILSGSLDELRGAVDARDGAGQHGLHAIFVRAVREDDDRRARSAL
jgi:ABC-type uncharacterized transport system ATPase subunit